jgi:hypothetical protein
MFTEEFSLPKVNSNTNIPHHFPIPPSPWRVASLVYPDYNLDEDNNGKGGGFSRKNFSYLERRMKREMGADAAASPEQTSEEKMDMLWEDFNEELQRVSSMKKKTNKEAAQRLSDSEPEDGHATKEIIQAFCRLQALKMPKTSKRPNLMVLMKIMLKKLILRMRNSPQIK